MLGKELKVVNLGLELFAETLEQYGVTVVQMDWRPPAGGDPRLIEILRQLNPNRSNPGDGSSTA